jgi:uncharacterized protein (DUF1501 family)
MNRKMSRRFFLGRSAVTMVGLGNLPLWLSRAVYARETAPSRKKILIAIFQRGAVDGLNMIIPHGDSGYYAARPSLAIARPGSGEGSAIDLDGYFGLHPALRALKPLWDTKQLAVVEACGSPDSTRSHFDAQDYMESGTPGVKSTIDGWLNRALPQEKASSVRAVSFTPDLPHCLRGSQSAITIESLNDFQVRDSQLANALETMYRSAPGGAVSRTARETFEATEMIQRIESEPYTPQNGAQYPNTHLGRSLRQIARLIKADIGLEVAFTDVRGWDTHVNEVGAEPHSGRLTNLLRDFGDSLAAFSQDIDHRMTDISLVTMSEFGRTVRENGSRGTDHGHANVMFVLGGAVRGGRVYGIWPGLAEQNLYEGRDLAVTTDFRDVLSELVMKQLHASDIAHVFPKHHACSLGLLG